MAIFFWNETDGFCGGMLGVSSTMISNSIFWANRADFGGDQLVGGNFTNCDIEGSGGSAAWDSSLGTDGGGNIDSDPLFVGDGADGVPGTEDDDLRLLSGSPCIDAGDNIAVIGSADLDGFARVVDGDCDDVATVDMGAYEFNHFVPGDFDGRGCDVDYGDFAVLAQSWLDDNPAIDIAPSGGGDGIIDLNELLVLADNWLAGI